MIARLKILKSFGKFWQKVIRDILCPICCLRSSERRAEKWRKGTRLNCLVGLTSDRRKRFRGARPHLSLSHVINPDSPISNTLRSVLGLLILMALKRIRESIFFQNNKVTACKVKNRKEVANSFSFHFRVRSI